VWGRTSWEGILFHTAVASKRCGSGFGSFRLPDPHPHQSQSSETEEAQYGGSWSLATEAWRLKIEPWRVCRPIVVYLHRFNEEQDPGLHQSDKKSDPDPVKVKRILNAGASSETTKSVGFYINKNGTTHIKPAGHGSLAMH